MAAVGHCSAPGLASLVFAPGVAGGVFPADAGIWQNVMDAAALFRFIAVKLDVGRLFRRRYNAINITVFGRAKISFSPWKLDLREIHFNQLG